MLLYVIRIGLTLLCVYGLVDAPHRPPAAGVAPRPQTKAARQAGVLVLWVFGILGSFLALPAAVAAIVYLVDVKPALSGESRPW